VLREGATSRSVLPAPGAWFHVWTGRFYSGGANSGAMGHFVPSDVHPRGERMLRFALRSPRM